MEKRRRKKTAVVIHAMMMQQYLQQIQTSVTKNNVSASVTVMNNGLSYIICWKKNLFLDLLLSWTFSKTFKYAVESHTS